VQCGICIDLNIDIDSGNDFCLLFTFGARLFGLLQLLTDGD